MGICDHCRNKAQSMKKPVCVCDEIVNKFISAYTEQKENLKKHFKPGLQTTLKKPQLIKIRAYSDSQILINQGLTSPASGHEPEVKPMFYSEKASDNISDTEIKEIDYKKQSVTFLEPVRPMGTPFGLTPHESVNGTIAGKSFADIEELPRSSLKDRKQEEIFEDTPSMDAKEALKRRHDLSMRQMMGLDKDSGGPYSALKRPDVYETPKIAPWEQQKTKHNVSEIQLIHVQDFEEKPKKVKKLGDRHFTDEELQNLQRSADKISHKPKTTDTKLSKSKSSHKKPHKTKETIKSDAKPQFSFFFPKGKEKVEKKKKVDVSSSHLIKETQKKLYQEAETEKKKQEEQRQQKLEKKEKKRIAREEKKLQVEEKKILKDKKITEKQSQKDFEIKPVGEETRQHQASKDSESAIKGTETKPERRDKIDKEFDKAKTKPKPEQGRKIDVLLQKTQKHKSETVQKDNDRVGDQEKSVLKQEPRQKTQKEKRSTKDEDSSKKVEILKKGSKDLKSETENKDKIIEPKTADKVESERKDEEKEQTTKMTEKERLEKIKREKEAKELIERMREMKNLRKEIEPLKQQPVIEEKKGVVKKKGKSEKQESDGSKLNAEQLKGDVLVNNKKQELEQKVETHTKTAEEERLERIKREKEIQELSDKMKQIELLRQEKEARKQRELEAIYKEKQAELKQKEKQKSSAKQESDGPKLTAEQLQELALMKKKEQELDLQFTKQMEKEIKFKVKEKPVLLKLNDIKVQREFVLDDLILALVRLKQAAAVKKPVRINFKELKEQTASQLDTFSSFYPNAIYFDSELDVLSLVAQKQQPSEIITDVVIGEKIVKLKYPYDKTKVSEVDDKHRKMVFFDTNLPPKEIQIFQKEAEHAEKVDRSSKKVDFEATKGILRYSLSDRSFIEKGWTMLPTEKVVRKMNVYRMRPAHPEFDWFEHNKNKRLMTYDSGERLAEFDDNGRGRWYYRSGRLALDYYDAEETNAQQRFVVYSSGEPDERGRTHPITILATFDYLGNGIVFDHSGKIRLKYNQTEGVVLDRGIGPVSHWKWHTLNDPPVLQQVMIDTQMAHKDPEILKLGPPSDKETKQDNAEMLAIEFDNFIKEKSKKLSQKFKPFQIKMKALKINEHFSLRVLDQATVYLIFRDGSTNLKLNIGMILDHQEIVDTDTAEVGEVSNSLERFPARTDSLAGLQRSVAYAQRYERQRSNREARLRPAEPCASADHLVAASSRPMRLPIRTVPTGSSSSTGCCSRKPTNMLYYNTRLL